MEGKANRYLEYLSTIDENLLDAFIDNPYECPIVIDNQGIVRFMSRFNTEVHGVGPEEAVGKHITEIKKNTRLHEVLKTGKAEIGEAVLVGSRRRIIGRIPLRDREGVVIGALGKLMFHHPDKIKDLYERLEILEEQVKHYQTEIAILRGGDKVLDSIIGESEAIRNAKKLALQAARTDASVLITGESGTGKELFAEAIHRNSRRCNGPYIRFSCAAIPRDLLESELFGYEGGAFTGARSQGKPGKFELAHGGTILLDEIGDMALDMQAKLLRVIQEHEVERVGSTRPLKLDFRVIGASNQDLGVMIRKGTFRMDLFYRLNTFHIVSPSLRRIPEDIPRIANYLLSQIKKTQCFPCSVTFSSETMELLKRYSWEGNVRELKNVIERAVNIAEDSQIKVCDLPNRIQEFYRCNDGKNKGMGLLRDILVDAEKRAIVKALHMTDGNRAKAAKILGIHRTGLYQKLKSYEVNV